MNQKDIYVPVYSDHYIEAAYDQGYKEGYDKGFAAADSKSFSRGVLTSFWFFLPNTQRWKIKKPERGGSGFKSYAVGDGSILQQAGSLGQARLPALC